MMPLKRHRAKVFHADVWGVREQREGSRLVAGKYHWLENHHVFNTDWTELTPDSPDYRFDELDRNLEKEYQRFWPLTSAMPLFSAGIVSGRDHLCIQFTEQELIATLKRFSELSEEDARRTFMLGNDSSDWKVSLAQMDVQSTVGPAKVSAPILYRPFDIRHTYYSGNTAGFLCRPRPEVMQHMLAGPNRALITTRQTRDPWDVFVTSTLAGHKSVAAYDINSVFPLYIYPVEIYPDLVRESCPDEPGRRANLAPEFTDLVGSLLRMKYIPEGRGDLKNTFGPEDLFDYLYALFYAPSYRARYAAYLKIDFPRIPLTSNKRLFRRLCTLGSELMGVHLLDRLPALRLRYPVSGTNTVDCPRYVAAKPGRGGHAGRVYINDSQYFEGVESDVWTFRVGGYQVCEKWLKDRKHRELSFEDIEHYRRIVRAIEETRRLMQAIDTTIPGWPIE